MLITKDCSYKHNYVRSYSYMIEEWRGPGLIFPLNFPHCMTYRSYMPSRSCALHAYTSYSTPTKIIVHCYNHAAITINLGRSFDCFKLV